MGLGDLSPEGAEESSGGNQSTYITFKNPNHPEVELDEGTEHRHEQEFYDGVQQLRDLMGRDINVAFGRFAAAAVEAEKNGNDEQLQDLFEAITSE